MPALLIKICTAESGFRQYNSDGSALHGKVNPHDIGLCQINEPIWGKTAEKLGYDIYTESGNAAMAIWILQNDPRHEDNWIWSKYLWDK